MLRTMEEPMLIPTPRGWLAKGSGWAVEGQTRETALQNFRDAARRHQEIDARPFIYDLIDRSLRHLREVRE